MDGVRADAVPLFGMPVLERLAAAGAWTLDAETVRPSVTAAAMGSLFTGVTPGRHGLETDRFRIPRPRGTIDPLPHVLARQGVPTCAALARVPMAYRSLAHHLSRRLGIAEAVFAGERALDIVAAATGLLGSRSRGLFVFHWPDADRTGHAHGWTSRRYAAAVHGIDAALGVLVDELGVTREGDTVLIALADHGGGGLVATNHDSDHPHDRRIPLVFSGAAVEPGRLAPGLSLLDVPATVAWALGAPVPPDWNGRPVTEAFQTGATRDAWRDATDVDRYRNAIAC
jgi:arylsulfatase A-like enzyme